MLRPLDRKHLGHMDHSGLGYAVDRALGKADDPVGRGHVYDTTRPPAADEMPAHLLAHEESSGHVGPDHRVPFRGGDLQREPAQRDPGIVDQHGYTAENIDDSSHGLLDAGLRT